jgi:hypothetical protein
MNRLGKLENDEQDYQARRYPEHLKTEPRLPGEAMNQKVFAMRFMCSPVKVCKAFKVCKRKQFYITSD